MKPSISRLTQYRVLGAFAAVAALVWCLGLLTLLMNTTPQSALPTQAVLPTVSQDGNPATQADKPVSPTENFIGDTPRTGYSADPTVPAPIESAETLRRVDEPVFELPSVEPVPNTAIIQFAPGASQADRAAYLQSIGASTQNDLMALDIVTVSLPPQSSFTAMSASEVVLSVEPDYYVMALREWPTRDPRLSEQWAMPAIHAQSAWTRLPLTVETVTVAVIDSGVCASHPDLMGRTVGGYDFVEGDADPTDTFGHGCGVSGLIAANSDNDIGITGLAPHVMIMPLRVLDGRGIGTYSDVAAAIVYAVDHGAKVINLSLGGAQTAAILQNAILYAQQRNVIVVAAAGNNGRDGALYPAAFDGVYSVGALDPNMQRSSFSNYGALVRLYAPGRDLLTTSLNGEYALVSGTSFAAPLVSAAAAIEYSLGGSLAQDGGALDFDALVAVPVTPVPTTATSVPTQPSEETTITGWLSVNYGDPAPDSKDSGQVMVLLHSQDNAPIELVVPLGEASVYHGEQVRVTGALQSGAQSALASGADTTLVVENIASIGAKAQAQTGTKPYANILCRFSDSPDQMPHDIPYYQAMMLGGNPSLDHYWRELSFDTLNIAGTQSFGWFDLPHPRDYYVIPETYGANLTVLARDCAAAAMAAEVNLAEFFGINFMFNQHLDCCAWGGGSLIEIDGEFKFFATTWLPPWSQNHGVVTHEMGHAFGLPHSSGPSHNPPSELSIYISAWDVMSASAGTCVVYSEFGCVAPGTIGYHYDLLGWIDDRRVTVPTNSVQTITLDRLDQPEGDHPMLIMIPIDDSMSHFYTVEVRDLFGYDRNVPAQAVVIHDVQLGRGNNTGPALVVDNDLNNNVNDEGAMWRVGEMFQDNERSIEIRVLSQEGSTFTIQVSNGVPLVPDAPINLQGTNTTPFSATLRWTDKAFTETGFKIYRGTGTNYELISMVGANIKTYTDNAAVCSESLSYYVTAYNIAGESTPTNVVTPEMPPCAAINDTPQTAYPVSAALPYHITQSGIQTASTSASEPAMTCLNPTRGYSHTVWYSFTPTVSQKIELSTVGEQSSYDTVLALYKGAPNALTSLGCDNDSGGSGKSLLAPSAALNAGTTYYIMIARKGVTPTSDPLTLRLNLRTVVYQPTNAEQLINAVKQANSSVQPDTIMLVPGATYTMLRRVEGLNALPVITSELTIISEASNAAARPVITRGEGAPTMRFLTVAAGAALNLGKVKFSQGRLINGGMGGAILNAGTLSVWDTEFSQNSADWGGAIRTEGTLTIRDSAFTGNSAAQNGGGIDAARGTLTLTDVTFTDNRAAFGGGLQNTKAAAVLTRVNFSNNQAMNVGGGFYNRFTLVYQSGVLSDNTAQFSGGGFANQGEITLSDARLTGNSAYVGGGIENSPYPIGSGSPGEGSAEAEKGRVPSPTPLDSPDGIEAQGGGNGSLLGVVILNNVMLESNTGEYGAAIRSTGGSVTLTSVTVRDHTSTMGAIFNSTSVLTITGGLFENNQSLNNGGALYSEYGYIEMTGPMIWRGNNALVGSGGAIAAHNYVIINNATFEDNTSGANGGGLLIGPNGGGVLNNSRFLDNSAYYQGGAIFAAGWTFSDDGGLYSGNTASDGGGAIAFVASPAVINNARFVSNITEGYGGAIWHHGFDPSEINELRVTNSTFTVNNAYWGGALYATANETDTGHAPMPLMLTGNIFHFNQAIMDGGAIGTEYATGQITDSCITANATGSRAAVTHVGEMLNATNNWWGLSAGPNTTDGDNISGPIDSANFKTSAPSGCNVSNDYVSTALTLWDDLPINLVLDDATPADASASDPALPAGCLAASASLSHTTWWRYTPSHSGQTVDFDTMESSFDTVLAAWKQDVNGALTAKACNDNSGGPQSKIRLSNLNVGETYLLMIGAAQPSGELVAHFNAAVIAPSNDDFAQASAVNPQPYRSSINTEGATTGIDDPLPTCDNSVANTVWYRYTASSTKPQTFTTEGSDYDTLLVVYTGTRGSLTEIACSDNVSETDKSSRVTITPQAGKTYMIMIAGSDGQKGSLMFGAPQTLGIPTLIAPSSPTTTQSQPTFTWSGVAGANRFDIQIDVNNPPMSAPVRVNGTSYKPVFPLLPRVYSWRVRAVDAQGFGGEWSSIRTLVVASAPNQAPHRNYFATPTPTLSWSRISGATAYEVQVDDAANFNTLVFQQVTPDGGMLSAITTPLPNGLYSWRVRARQANGAWTPWSSIETFTLDTPSGDQS